MVSQTRRKKRKELGLSQEEYKELRAEMMQRFEYTRNLLLFLITSTIALLSFLALARVGLSSSGLSPLLFVVVGLSLTSFNASSYLTLHQGIYRSGSYLAVFHELGSKNLRWHWLNRFGYDEWIKEKPGWAKADARRGSIFPILAILNWIGPTLILSGTIIALLDYSLEGLILLGVAVGLSIYIAWKYIQLYRIRKEMRKTMYNWLALREEIENDPRWFEKRVEEQIAEIRKEFSK